ncbi:MAG: hypothetical protein P8Q99_10715 [Paracoccaceae bacterium]|nr:hypothetical protein [Paracoccaceae bacterium]
MSKETPYVVIHAGVHKTASTYSQKILKRNQGYLEKIGVRYVHHRKTRKEYTIPVQLNGYANLGLNFKTKVTDGEMKKASRKFFKSIGAKKGERIVISDENVAGHCGHCVKSGVLYNRRSTLIPGFAKYMKYPVKEVHFAVRNYADFFASSYVEFLRNAKGGDVVDDTHMKLQVQKRVPSWVGFANDFAKAFPEAKIVIWQFENFRDLSDEILRALCGEAIGDREFAMPSKINRRPSASARAVEEMLKMIHMGEAEEALEKRVEIQDKFPRSDAYPGYDPWTEREREHLDRLYARDWAQLGKDERFTLLRTKEMANA